MKIKHIILASAVLLSVASFAQKDELKALKKIYDKDDASAKDLIEYKGLISKTEPLILNSNESDKVYFDFYKASIPFLEMTIDLKKPENLKNPTAIFKYFNPMVISAMATSFEQVLNFEKKSGKKVLTDDINEAVPQVKPLLINYAVSLADTKKFKEAADVLYSIYQLDKKDQDKLFFAASYAVNAIDYDKALEYYNQLKALNYSGEGTVYWATNKASKKEETFNSKTERDLFIKTGTHEKPRDEKLESKRGEIYKNIALIFVQKGKIDEAKAAVAIAKKENPNDTSLILTEADLYLKVNDFDTYTKLVNEALAKEPNNADLVYNLGVISGNANKLVEADKYYRRTLQIDPNYFNANLNLAELILRADDKLVKEMNKLGTSEKDNKRYEIIKAEREKNFKSALPFLEKAVELKSDDVAAKKTLLSVYNALEMTEKYKALKAKM